MLYDISLGIEYSYDRASDNARNMLRLVPRAIEDVQIVSSSIVTVDPAPDECVIHEDFFGNETREIAYHAPIEGLTVTLRARVERLVQDNALDVSPLLEVLARELSTIRDLGRDSPHHFRAGSARIAPDAQMEAFARDCLAPDMTVRQAVFAIGQALHAAMAFDAEATDVDTPAAVAFAKRRGVCQDFSHIMITCLRDVGIPAGYVSGFLRTIPPKGRPRLEGADAMHAWVRAWCGRETGWIEFDPTNDLLVGTDHIVAAYGRDYSDVAPVKGVFRTSGNQETRHMVDVLPL